MKKFFFLALLLTFTFPAYAATPKRVVYTIERPTTLNGTPAMDYQLWSVRVDGKDDRLLDEATQPENIRSIVEFPIDNRILVIQEHKDGTERRAILTAKGKDVTNQYPGKYFENDPQLSTRLQSPNRKFVAFVKPADVGASPEIKPYHVYVRNQKTKKLRDFLHKSFQEIGLNGIYPIAWSPDSKFLYVQSGSYEGPAQIRLWRITVSNGAVYEYKSVRGVEAFWFSVNADATFALGTRSKSEGMSSSPPSEIIRIDLKKDVAKVLRKSATSVFMQPLFTKNPDTIIFNEQRFETNVVAQKPMAIQKFNIRTGAVKEIGSASETGLSTSIVDGRWLVYELRAPVKDGAGGEIGFYLYDFVKGTSRLLARDNSRSERVPICPDPQSASASALCEKQRVHIVGIFSE